MVVKTFRAIVQNGRLVIRDEVPLPEGTELDLSIVDTGDDLSDEERRELHEALRASWASAQRGEVDDVDGLIQDLRS